MSYSHRHLAGAYLKEESDPELLEWVRSLPKGQVAKAVKTGLMLVQYLRTLPEGDAFFRRGILLEAIKTGLLALPGRVPPAGAQHMQTSSIAAPAYAPPISTLPVEATIGTAERDPEKDLDRLLGG